MDHKCFFLFLSQVKTVIGGLAGADPVVCSRQVVIKPDMSLDEAIKQVLIDSYDLGWDGI